ncbi:hypothetical protein [Streptomyces sp. NPDC101455]|uniref:hypothetical protein n=1 Tax=Streptomyces sp. NPDC101455 TaxID=3366142 RepID=UPI0038265A13
MVRGATDDRDGCTYQTDQSGNPLHFDDYGTLIKDKVTGNGAGDAPGTGAKKRDYTPPGITGGQGTLTFPGYRLW